MSVARQLTKKFEHYKSRKTDSNQLLLHIIKKMVTEKVITKYIMIYIFNYRHFMINT